MLDINISTTDSGEPSVDSSQPETTTSSNGITECGSAAVVETTVKPETSGTLYMPFQK